MANESILTVLVPGNWSHDGSVGHPAGGRKGDTVQGALLVAIATLGVILNVFLVLAILPNPRMRSVRQVLLVHLGLVGIVTSLVLTLPAGVLQLTAAFDASSTGRPPASANMLVSSPASPSIPLHSSAGKTSGPSPAAAAPQDLAGPSPISPTHDVIGPTPQLEEEDGWAGPDGGGKVLLEGAWCTVVGAFAVLLTAASVWTVAALAWDKHRAIANPLHHPLAAHRNTMTVWFTALWVLAVALATPPLLGGGDLRFIPALSRCGMHAGSTTGRWHAMVVVLVGILTPLSIMFYCYTHIFRIARAQSSRIAATMLRMVTLIQAPIAPTPTRNAGLVRLRGTRAMATIVQLVGSCVASYVPWAVLLVIQAASDVTPSGVTAGTAAMLLHAAPLTAATVYGLRNRNLRASFMRWIRSRLQHWCRLRRRRRPSIKSLTRKLLHRGAPQTGRCSERGVHGRDAENVLPARNAASRAASSAERESSAPTSFLQRARALQRTERNQ
ncbi:hypothetical protein BaRGS_00037972 [Batillaria attramentaria]|uniref:G-protein coupled receptors family 1 profile domain-containing protein n=1 Tax=Batillaria attramentaria TaxID=370345 RepID=A0ABD0J7M4_9CAEN